MAGIDHLIINSAYHEPTSHWKYDLRECKMKCVSYQQFTAFKPLAHRPKPMLAKP